MTNMTSKTTNSHVSVAQANLILPIYEHPDGRACQVTFNKDGWVNATAIAEQFGKRLDHWLSNQETKDYMVALSESINTRNPGDYRFTANDLLSTKRGKGGGTWLHPRLSIAFARWLSPELAVWMDNQLFQILSGEWERRRLITAEYYKEMQEELSLTREQEGKATAAHHFSNEAKLVNRVLSLGVTGKLDHRTLTVEALQALGKLERKNANMIARGWDYQKRKEQLQVVLASEYPMIANGEVPLSLPVRDEQPSGQLGQEVS
mgnify:CR=1 FL=1